LYLMGNPCTEFPGWRKMICAMLPQLTTLDSEEITHSERIQARHELFDLKQSLRDAIEEAALVRNSSLAELPTETSYTPENRLKMYRGIAADRETKEKARKGPVNHDATPDSASDPFVDARKRMGVKQTEGADGSLPKMRNQCGWQFTVEEDERGNVVVDIAVERYLSTSLLDVDIHPLWFQIQVKDKLMLLHVPEEIKPDSCKVQRVQANGHLVLIMPKVNQQAVVAKKTKPKPASVAATAASATATAAASSSSSATITPSLSSASSSSSLAAPADSESTLSADASSAAGTTSASAGSVGMDRSSLLSAAELKARQAAEAAAAFVVRL
jgi:protein TilB